MLRSTGSHLAQLLSQSASGQLQLASCWRQLSSKAKGTTLAYEEMTTQAVTQGEAQGVTIMLMHGLLGSGRNWRSFARRLVADAESRHHIHLRLQLLDLRNHGASSQLPGLHPPHSVEAAASDVQQVMRELLPRATAPFALIGHSLGGKVSLEALRLLAEAREALPSQTWVLDSPPGMVPHEIESRTGVSTVLNMVHEISLPVPSRQHLLQHLRSKGLSEATALWLGSNLVPDAHGKLGWAFRTQGATAMYQSYRHTDCWGMLEQTPVGSEVHLVQGALSDRWSPDTVRRMKAAAARPSDNAKGSFHLHLLERAGHNLHMDNAQGLHDLLLSHIVRGLKQPQQ